MYFAHFLQMEYLGLSAFLWFYMVLDVKFSGLFPLNEDRENQDISSKIHGIGSALGFTALLFCPLLISIASFKANYYIWGTVSLLSFVVALIFFSFFIMGEKEKFSRTVLQYGGLWQRLVLLFSYLPFFWFAIGV